MRDARTALLVAGFVVLAAAGFGGGFTYAQLTDTETKQVSVSAGTWTTTPEETLTSSRPVISFVAFCVADDTDAAASTVGITDVQRNDDGEPSAVTYESTVELSTVVLFGGNEFENFGGETSGTVVFGDGTTPDSAGTGKPGTFDQMPPAPCPSGETEAVKFEYDGGSDTFVSEVEAEGSGSTGNAGAQSVEAASSEPDETNQSNATPAATPTETTVETFSTSSETQVSETPTATETATPTATETATPTATETATPTATPSPTTSETETATAASVNGTDQGEDRSIGNESEGTDADA